LVNYYVLVRAAKGKIPSSELDVLVLSSLQTPGFSYFSIKETKLKYEKCDFWEIISCGESRSQV